jgi:hypothetical protein
MKKRRKFLKALGMGLASLGVHVRSTTAETHQHAGPHVWTNRPETYTTDVLVVGGGPAGIGAAVGAARTGTRTLLVENHACLGGAASFGIGMSISQMLFAGKPRSIVHQNIIDGLQQYGSSAVRIGEHQLLCNVDYLRVVLMDLLDEAGCSYLLHTRAVDAIVENNEMKGVVIATKQGLVRIGATIVVDCTGDADIAWYANAETMIEEGSLATGVLLMNLTNIDEAAVRQFRSQDVAEKAKAKYPLIPDRWSVGKFNSEVTWFVGHPGTQVLGQFDGSDTEQLTRAEAFSRRQAVQIVEAMREFGGKDMRNIELSRTGMQIGVRETRRVKGLYVLADEDVKSGKKFEDSIAWNIPVRGGRLYDVPYRSIVPEKLNGMLIGGRCISTSHEAASAGKHMGNCFATGHAAGLSAALCYKQQCQPRELSVAHLQDALRKDGASIDRK